MFGRAAVCLLALMVASGAGRSTTSSYAGDDWPYYHGDPAGTHYSTLTDIDAANVGKLRLAWSYDTGESMGEGALAGDVPLGSDMQSNPLVVGRQLFFVSPKGRLICLDAESGKEQWTFDASGGKSVASRQRLRGVSWWSSGDERRVLFTFRGRLYSVDADSGKLVTTFGDKGSIDLRDGVSRASEGITVSNVTPGAVWKDLIVMGSTGNTPGDIRAYDVRTGKVRWVFHTIPHPGEFGYETWPKDAWKTAMGANNWAGMAVDEKRGIVFIPLASGGMANKDFYGADRHGDNLFANSLVALDAATGKRLWHFQTVRHDIWDRDLPAPPTLVTVERGGKKVDAVAQITKSGFVFVLDRVTGKPLFPIEEVPGFASDMPGEKAAPSQIRPKLPAPFARQHVTEALLTRRTPEAHAAARKAFSQLRSRGQWDPPSLQGTLLLPGMDGGGEWGGTAFDPQTGLLYVNSNEMAWILRLKKKPAVVPGAGGRGLYIDNCSACHGEDRAGNPPEFPSLVGIGSRLEPMDIYMTIASGSGRMPGFSSIGNEAIGAIMGYLLNPDAASAAAPTLAEGKVAAPSSAGDAYIFDGYHKFLDPDGYPAIAPPWGTLSAINLNTGQYVWKIPFGEYPELAAKGLRNTGSENYGGPIVTAGGLLFIGATVYDNKFRAFDKRTGKLLWETTLPAGGNATPSTYRVGGRQFVVITAGGGKNAKAKPGSTIVAFALPQ